MFSAKKILIVGGGPAGALCGERLARAGFDVTLFEERRGWEKPCGGGVTWKTLVRYPFLLDDGLDKKLVRAAEFIADDGRRARLELSRPVAVFSRAALNEFLLRRAEVAGCRLVPARVTAADLNGGVRLRTSLDEFTGDFLVAATGARRAFQAQGAQPIAVTPHDLELTLGYYLSREENHLRLKFFDGLEGYLWTFPRVGHLAVGICGRMAQNTSAGLRERLERFLASEGLSIRGAQLYSHILPSPERRTLGRLSLAGPNWARIGDAGALVDPVTGEGIYYALRSGELLAEAIIHGDAGHYTPHVEKEILSELGRAAGWQPRFYRARWLGRPTTTRLVQLLGRSQRVRDLLDDLIAGTQGYRGLGWRFVRTLFGQRSDIH